MFHRFSRFIWRRRRVRIQVFGTRSFSIYLDVLRKPRRVRISRANMEDSGCLFYATATGYGWIALYACVCMRVRTLVDIFFLFFRIPAGMYSCTDI